MIITVVGLGVIGGSFVKALKGKGYDVYGVDCDQQTLEMAKAEGCIIEGYLDGHQIISQSDLTIICLYPSDGRLGTTICSRLPGRFRLTPGYSGVLTALWSRWIAGICPGTVTPEIRCWRSMEWISAA